MKTPIVTVLMPVFNGEKYLDASINSILKQTYKDFEFLIIDDGSTDATDGIVHSFNDSRIKFLKNQNNLGIVATLNKGISLAQGEFIARMDADDISLPHRLEKQVNFMRKHMHIGICGCGIINFGNRNYINIYPEKEKDIRALLLFNAAFPHPGVMAKTELLKKYKYNGRFRFAQDYELWTRIIHATHCANLPEVLLHYRQYDQQTSQKKRSEQLKLADQVRFNYLKSIHPSFERKDAEKLGKIARREFMPFSEAKDLLEKILSLHNSFFDEKSLKEMFAKQYWWMLGSNGDKKLTCWREYRKFLKYDNNRNVVTKRWKFHLKCLIGYAR